MGYPSCSDETQHDSDEREHLRECASQDAADRERDKHDQDDPVQPTDIMKDVQES